MKITFHGAAQEVTGSCFLIETEHCRFLVDCGMAQGGRQAAEHNHRPFGFDPKTLDFVLLTHAHIDHSGLLPKLALQGFEGSIFTTRATADLLEVMLPDSGHIQEMEAERAMRKRRPNARPALYTALDAMRCLKQIKRHNYDLGFNPHATVRVRLRDAGHILGSAIAEIWITESDRTLKLVASGDLGQPGRPILRDPCLIEDADVLLIESTYGNRLHKDEPSTLDELVKIVNTTLRERKGNVVVPAFAVGRTQEMIYHFHRLAAQGRLGHLDIFVDSPMAVAATSITQRHVALFDHEAQRLYAQRGQGKGTPKLHFISDVSESIQLNRVRSGAVIISASGMCDAGRVLHHLRHNLGRPECAVVITGFQAQGTLGRRLVDGEKTVRVLGEEMVVRASIHTLGGFSAHADQQALLGWAAGFSKPPGTTFVVHGEPEAANVFAAKLRERHGWMVTVPTMGQAFTL